MGLGDAPVGTRLLLSESEDESVVSSSSEPLVDLSSDDNAELASLSSVSDSSLPVETKRNFLKYVKNKKQLLIHEETEEA